MAKLPYIAIYPGDWARDADLLTDKAEYALFKLTIKLNDAKNKGIFIANYQSLSILFKCDLECAKQSIKELKITETLDILDLEDGFLEIKSRRLLREKAVSEARSEAGKHSQETQKTNKTSTKAKQTVNKRSTKPQQNTEIEIENEVVNDIKVVGVVDNEMLLIFERWVDYKNARKEKYKTSDSLKTAFEKLVRFSKGDHATARTIIDDAIGNNYAGFFEPKVIGQPHGIVPVSKAEIAVNSHLNFMQKRHGQ